MNKNTLVMTTLALTLVLAPAALFAQAYEEPAASTSYSGCLQSNDDGTGYVLIDEAAGSEIALTGAEEDLALASGNNVTVTGTASTDADGNPVVEVESVKDSGEPCAASDEADPMDEGAMEEHPGA